MSANGTTPAQMPSPAAAQCPAPSDACIPRIAIAKVITTETAEKAIAATSFETRNAHPDSGVTRSWRFQPIERSVTSENAWLSAAIIAPYAVICSVVTTRNGRCVTGSTWPPYAAPKTRA